MIDYIIKVLIFQTLFLAVYDLFLKKETFFQWNRVYLILTSIFAYLIPFLKVNRAGEIIPQEYIVLLPEVILSPTATIEQKLQEPQIVLNYVQFIFWLGVILTSIFFLLKLFRIIQLIYNNEKVRKGSYLLVFLKNSNAFSFFNYIFLGKTISTKSKEQIIEHELIHVQQKHSIDLLIFELQKIVCWFNPFSYIFQHRISELHEFIADSKAIKEKDKTSYFNNLLTETFGVQHISFINPFFKHSLIKKRIVMLSKNKSTQLSKLKYLLIIPVLLSMLVYTSCEKGEFEQINKNEKRLTSLFIGSLDNSGVEEIKSKTREHYFDFYLNAEPPGKEISYDDLSNDEKKEYDKINNGFNKNGDNFSTFKIYEDEYGKRSLLMETDWKGMKESRESNNYSNADEVPFAVIEKSPIFPGCENAEDQKKCFEESISNYITQNFDPSMAKSLGLEKGKKRIYVQFLIKKNGQVSYIRARAPHEKLEDEAKNLIYDLPDMQPGEHNGKKVAVEYTLPITFVVE
jgi:hypothetical protein